MDAKVNGLVIAAKYAIFDLKEWVDDDCGEKSQYYIEITEERIKDLQVAIDDLTTKECPTCHGKGTVKGKE